MYTLGLNYLSHDASAVLLKNNRIICAVEEERLNRKVHYSGFPTLSIKKCLETADITIKDVDVISSDGITKETRKNRIMNYIRLSHYEKAIREIKFFDDATSRNVTKTYLKKNGFESSARIDVFDHHQCHAASAFFPSGLKKSSVVTADARGFYKTMSAWEGEDNEIRLIDFRLLPDSPGYVYKYITYLCGYGSFSQGTTMALAPYGKPVMSEKLFKLYPLISNWTDIMDLIDTQFSKVKFDDDKLINSAYEKLEGSEKVDVDEIKNESKENLAASVQKWLENYMTDYVTKFKVNDNLSLAGGTFLNCILNSKLKRDYFKEVYVQPAASDSGLALGAAILTNEGKIEKMEHAYYGPEYSSEEIEEAINEKKLKFEKSNENHAAELLAKGKIVAWYQGKMEFGPRALGNRSILADPGNMKTKERLNKKVKQREEFRPYAPSVLFEKMDEYFDDSYISPFMTMAFNVKKEKQEEVNGIVHIDGTSRVQTVHRHTNERYHKLISKFQSIKGIPMVLNTSFNRRGEPIVNTPKEAIDMYLTTGIDYLFLGDYLVYK